MIATLLPSRGRAALASALLAGAMFAAPAAAQLPLSLGVGGGLAIPQGDLSNAVDNGFHGMATLRAGVPLVPVHLRVDGMYAQLGAGTAGSADLEVMAATANLGYDVVPLGLASLYVVGGGGYYWLKADVPGAEREGQAGWNAGAGVRFSLMAMRLFAEARYHAVNVEGGNVRLIPVTVGLSF